MKDRKITIQQITGIGMMAAAVYAASLLQIVVPTAIGNTRLHMGNVLCLLSGMLLGPVQGGLAAGIGSMYYDLSNPAYLTSAPFTFLFKFIMAWLCGKVVSGKGTRDIRSIADKCGQTQGLHIRRRYILGSISGSFAYVLCYLTKAFVEHRFVMGMPSEAVLLTVAQKAAVSCTNAVIACAVAVPLGLALRPVMARIIR